jgi:hypothetical protein
MSSIHIPTTAFDVCLLQLLQSDIYLRLQETKVVTQGRQESTHAQA